MPLPTPAPFSSRTWCPRAVSAATPPGTSPTRYSRVLISIGQPMIISSLRSRFALRKRAAEDSRQSPRVKLRRVEMLKLLFADPSGRVYEHPELLALARDGFPPEPAERLPAHATLAALPGRRPVGLDPSSGRVVELSEVRIGRRTLRPSAVAAVVPPGWTRSELPAFRKTAIAPILPQWAYTAAAWDDARRCHVVWALHTDKRRHWDPATRSTPDLSGRVRERLASDANPLLRQLAKCALEYRCFTAQNTFYARDEGAIPASSGCNARCVGCISEQPDDGPPASHQRLRRAPDWEEMAAIGIAHLARAPGRTMVSFGQGCEGEPLTRAQEIGEAIRRMRQATRRGSINVHTNGSPPGGLALLIDAGPDACPISLNNAHKPLVEAYYQPIHYCRE